MATFSFYATRQLNIPNLTTVPDSYAGTLHEKLEWLKRLAKSVVDFCWLGPLKEDIDDVTRGFHDGQNETLSGCMCGNGMSCVLYLSCLDNENTLAFNQ